MKKLSRFAAIALLAVSATGCSLDTESMTTIDSQTFYTTMDDASMAVIGCYDGYRRTVAGGPTFSFYVLSELMGDDCFGGTGVTDARNHQAVDRFDRSEYPTLSNQMESLWSLYYAAIFNCNSLLVQLDNISWEASTTFNTATPEETRAAVEGEARFLRAVEYFDLVRLFGRVPLLTEPTEAVVPQSEPEDVFEQIFEDLTFAAANIKYVPTADWTRANDGRATAEAAKAMLARAYLFYTGYYGQEPAATSKAAVIQGLQDIVGGGHYGLVQASENNGFARLWRAAVSTDAGDGLGLDNHDYVGRACENSDVNEFIFTQKFNYTSDYNGITTSNRLLVMIGLRGVTNVEAVPYGRGWGACTVNPESWNIYEEGDARREASIINFAAEGRSAAIDETVISDWREYTGYNVKKYIPLSYNVGGTAEAADYADAVYNGMDGNVDSWNWCADWAGNGSWMFGSTGAMDYGSITFDLIDGAHVNVVDAASGNNYSGTFLLDQENYTLTLTDAVIPHDPFRESIVTNWNLCRVISMTENTLQLGVVRDNDPSEGNCLLVYNFISQEYWDNPPVVEDPEPGEPVLPEGWQDIVGQITQTSIKWTLSEDTPLNWHSVAGVPLNEFNSAADYPDWLGTPDPAVYAGFSLTMDSADYSYVAVAPDGTETTGTYTLDEKGIYTFDNGLPTFTVINWASFAADADNQLRILQVNTNDAGIISDMWVGAKSLNEDGTLNEYMSYHLVANVGGGSGSDEPEGPSYDAKIYFTTSSWWPSGDGEIIKVAADGKYTVKFDVGAAATDAMVMVVDVVGVRNDFPAAGALVTDIRYDGVSVDFDPANIIYGDIEGNGNGNLRMEIYNTYGPTATYGSAIDYATAGFTTLEIDFEFSFNSHEAQVMMTNDGWWPAYSGVTQAGVMGVGKHLIKADMSENGAITVPMIFCLDVIGYPDAATATAGVEYMNTTNSAGESKDMTIHPENLAYGDLENKGNLRWEFFNIYGGTGNGVTSAPYDYSMSVIDGAEWSDVAGVEMLVTIR